MTKARSLFERLKPLPASFAETFDVFEAAPVDGFFPRYLRYSLEMSDAPTVFHLGAALAAFSASVAGKVQLEAKREKGGTITTPLHIWTMLVGDSGARKSSVCDRALRVLYTGETGPVGGSMEAVFSWVAAYPTSLFYFPELTSLLHQSGFAPFLSEVYDGGDMRRTLVASGGKKLDIVIMRPRATILTCATFGMLHLAVAKADWIGGIFGRMLPLYGTRVTLNPFGGAQDSSAENQLRDLLKKCMDGIGDEACIGLTSEAFAAYKDWMEKIEILIPRRPEHVRSALTRLPMHILRVAGLYAVSCFKTDVDADLMTRAIVLGNHAVRTIDKLGMVLSPDPVVRNMAVLRSVLEKFPEGLSLRDVQGMTSMAWRTLEAAASSMCETGELILSVNPETRQKWAMLPPPNTTTS